jgi:hypothetical protein
MQSWCDCSDDRDGIPEAEPDVLEPAEGWDYPDSDPLPGGWDSETGSKHGD